MTGYERGMVINMNKQAIKFVAVVAAVMVCLVFYALNRGNNRGTVVFNEALDEVVAVVDGDELLVRDVAFYVAYEEGLVEYYAKIYDDENTGAFWNAFTNHTFFRKKAKQSVIEMAVHDKIFYESSRAEDIVLTKEEEQYAADALTDFWSDLSEKQRNALGVTKEEMGETMLKITLAEKYQTYLAAFYEKEFEEYSYTGEAYLELLEEHDYEEGDIWQRIKFGGVTLNH